MACQGLQQMVRGLVSDTSGVFGPSVAHTWFNVEWYLNATPVCPASGSAAHVPLIGRVTTDEAQLGSEKYSSDVFVHVDCVLTSHVHAEQLRLGLSPTTVGEPQPPGQEPWTPAIEMQRASPGGAALLQACSSHVEGGVQTLPAVVVTLARVATLEAVHDPVVMARGVDSPKLTSAPPPPGAAVQPGPFTSSVAPGDWHGGLSAIMR
jgi:hypothetical protein